MRQMARSENARLLTAAPSSLTTHLSQVDLATLRVATASTTRRSAAIPYSILALVHGDKFLFVEACSSLLEVAENDGRVPPGQPCATIR